MIRLYKVMYCEIKRENSSLRMVEDLTKTLLKLKTSTNFYKTVVLEVTSIM